MNSQHDQAILVFVKNPVLGKVKTRLAATIGDERALEVYLQLLKHTFSIASEVKADLIICYSSFIPENDPWPVVATDRILQQGDDLGERMNNAISNALKTYNRVALIGSDCPELATDTLNSALESLKYVDSVVGPTFDGGYYLIGTTKPIPNLFDRIEWSTPDVFPDTLARLIRSNRSFKLLEKLNDVDNEEDLRQLIPLSSGR